MSRSKTFSSQYGYVLHPDSIDHTCFWCGNTCGFTWDYTPHRHIGKDEATVKHLNVKRIAVPACSHCISKTSYRKGQLLTIEDKQAFFAVEKEKAYGETNLLTRLKSTPRIPIWQRRMENGDIIDVPNGELNSFERKAKESWLAKFGRPDLQEEPAPEIPAYVSELAQPGAEAEGVPVSGPSSDVRGDVDIDVGF